MDTFTVTVGTIVCFAFFSLWTPTATAGRLADTFTPTSELDRAAADRERAQAEAARVAAQVDIDRARASADLERQGYFLERAREFGGVGRRRGLPVWLAALAFGSALVSLALFWREETRRKRAEALATELQARLAIMGAPIGRPSMQIGEALDRRGDRR